MGFISYFKGKKGLIFWANIILMIAILIAIPVLGFYMLKPFTHHGEKIEVPNVVSMSAQRAKAILEDEGFEVVISDSIETDSLQSLKFRPGAVIEQYPRSGTTVKSNRIIYLVTRYQNEARIEIPKLVGERSYREAKIILANLGFRFTPDSVVSGQQEGLLLGIYQGKTKLKTGDLCPKSKKLTLYVGGGVEEFIDDSVSYDTITRQVQIIDIE